MQKKTIDERFNLKGKTAVVVGGAGHLCSELCRAMVASGVAIAVLDIAKEPPADLSESVFYLRCDATRKEELTLSREKILKRFSRVDILLNGVCMNAPTPFFEITEEEIRKILWGNLVSTLFASQVFGEVMVKQRAGCILNFDSVSSEFPLSKAFIYSAAKAGVMNITQNLAREWAPYHVRVNALRPGFFPTEWSRKHFIDEERKDKILAHTPMGRFGKPEELVGASLWLISDEAAFVTGSIVAVDGGFTAMTI